MGTVQIDGSTPKITVGNATAEDATILFDGNAQDFYIALDDSADDLLIGLGSTVGTTPIIAIDENKLSTFSGAVTVGVDDTGHDVKLFGATSGSFVLWDESADSLLLTDSTPIKIGDSQDLTLYHDGSNSYITNKTGALKVATETSGIAITLGHTTSEVTVADNFTVTGTITLADGSLALADLDIDGGTDIGADIVDADLFIVDDGAGGTNRKTTATRIKTYAGFNAATITGTTALAENPQGTDEIILSDAGTLKRLDLKHMMNTPAFFAHGSTATAQSINNNTWTKIANLTTEKLDTDGTFASSAWTPGVAGYYWVNAAVYLGTLDDQEWGQLQFYTNGTDDLSQNGTLYSQNIQQVSSASDNYVATPHLSMVMYLDADDYVEIYARHNEGSAVNADTQFSWFQGFRITTGVLT
jgi:hypothetical protein